MAELEIGNMAWHGVSACMTLMIYLVVAAGYRYANRGIRQGQARILPTYVNILYSCLIGGSLLCSDSLSEGV